MIRTTFELKISAATLEEARDFAVKKIANFLSIDAESVPDKVTMEVRVGYPEAKTYADIAQNMDSSDLVVIVFATVKQSTVKPFGQ
jgi:hypothetical protein